MIKTTNSDIKAIVADILSASLDIFADHKISIYLMGSLSRGGFSETCSDIDIGIVFDSTGSGIQLSINDMISNIQMKHPNIENIISIFWGSVDSINGYSRDGRYPPFDRLDLIKSATLLYGCDIRDDLLLPSQEELEVSCAEFALQYLSKPNSLDMFQDSAYLVNQGTAALTKAILYPPRFIYLAAADEISTNQASAAYYLATFSGDDSILVEKGYQWRMEGRADDFDSTVSLLDKGLFELYNRFLIIYINKMILYKKAEIAEKLKTLQDKIISLN